VRTYRQKYVSHQQYTEDLCSHLNRWLKRKSRRLSQEWLEAALVLIGLRLDSALATLESLYSPDPRGQKPYEPVRMLRALLLMVLLKYTSITKFAKDLKAKPRLARIAGFEPYDTPAAGSFYNFMDRVEDGPYQKPSEYQTMHRIKPSQLRKGKFLRNLDSEKQQRQKDKEADAAVYDSVTQKLRDELLASHDQPRPDDLLKRLEDIFIQCAIIPSAKRGLLGDTDFGHRYYQHVVSTNGHDLPLHVSISRASETDYTLSMKDMDRLKKALRENGLEWKMDKGVYDAGHDSLGNYEHLMEAGITPIIALNPRTGSYPSPTGSAQKVDENGVPLCPAGVLMRRHTYIKRKHRIVYNCPVKRPSHKDGEHVWVAHTDECPHKTLCQPDSKMGPVVYVKSTDDPRLYPPVPRASTKHKRLMKLRSGCERSNSQKKEVYGLGDRPCRSDTHFLVRLYLVSIIEHAKAWLAEDKESLGTDDPTALMGAITA